MSYLRSALGQCGSLSIIGMCKNAGKTTVLTHLLALLSTMAHVPGLSSIGRDGELIDVVTGTEKPGIWIQEGALVATAVGVLSHCEVEREILHTTGYRTPLGEVIVFRALSDGYVQLAGPSMREQMIALTGVLRGFGAQIVLIDGAVSRKSLGAPSMSDAAILCTGASYHPDMNRVVEDTAFACRLLLLPKAGEEHENRLLVPGAVTDRVLETLSAQAGWELVVEDGSRLMISRGLFERMLARGVRFSVLSPSRVLCVCVNPFSARGMSFDGRAFREQMAVAVPVPVINVKEIDDG